MFLLVPPLPFDPRNTRRHILEEFKVGQPWGKGT